MLLTCYGSSSQELSDKLNRDLLAVVKWLNPYETRSAVAALQNGFKKRCRIAAKRLAAAVANFGCSGQRAEAV